MGEPNLVSMGNNLKADKNALKEYCRNGSLGATNLRSEIMVCELVVGAMGIGSMHLAWACLTRGWAPMAVMGMVAAGFCAALLYATRGPLFSGLAMLAVVSAGVWMLKNVKRAEPEHKPVEDGAKLTSASIAA